MMERITVRVDSELLARLDRLAGPERTRSEALRNLIRAHLMPAGDADG